MTSFSELVRVIERNDPGVTVLDLTSINDLRHPVDQNLIDTLKNNIFIININYGFNDINDKKNLSTLSKKQLDTLVQRNRALHPLLGKFERLSKNTVYNIQYAEGLLFKYLKELDQLSLKFKVNLLFCIKPFFEKILEYWLNYRIYQAFSNEAKRFDFLPISHLIIKRANTDDYSLLYYAIKLDMKSAIIKQLVSTGATLGARGVNDRAVFEKARRLRQDAKNAIEAQNNDFWGRAAQRPNDPSKYGWNESIQKYPSIHCAAYTDDIDNLLLKILNNDFLDNDINQRFIHRYYPLADPAIYTGGCRNSFGLNYEVSKDISSVKTFAAEMLEDLSIWSGSAAIFHRGNIFRLFGLDPIQRFHSYPPLFFAARKGHIKSAKLLIAFGARPDVMRDNYNILTFAKSFGHDSFITEILELCVHVDAVRKALADQFNARGFISAQEVLGIIDSALIAQRTADYTQNVMYAHNEPNLLENTPKGFYLYKAQNKVHVKVIHGNRVNNTENICLTDIDQHNLLSIVNWPRDTSQVGFIPIQLSKELITLIASNCQHLPATPIPSSETASLQILQSAQLYIYNQSPSSYKTNGSSFIKARAGFKCTYNDVNYQAPRA